MRFKETNIKNSAYNFYLDYLIKANLTETKNVLIYEKCHKNVVIYFTRYDCEKAIRILGPYCHELTKKKIEEDEGKKIFDDG